MVTELEDKHRDVVFVDQTSGEKFLISSTVETSKTTTIDGEEYPLYEVEISSSSHPFYTGEQKLVDTEGRVERFERKYGSMTGSSDESDEDEE